MPFKCKKYSANINGENYRTKIYSWQEYVKCYLNSCLKGKPLMKLIVLDDVNAINIKPHSVKGQSSSRSLSVEDVSKKVKLR